MIRWSFQFAHGWEPVAPSARPSGSTSATSWSRRSAIIRGTSANVSTLPVLISASEAISSPARCRSASVPARGRLHVLEAVDEIERDGVEQRELFLDGHGEVGGLLEALAGVSEELICWNALLVAHGA